MKPVVASMWIGILATLALLAGPAAAQQTDAEFTCKYKSSRVAWKFPTAKMKCILKCQKGAFTGAVPASDCAPPYANDALTCVQGEEADSAAAICTPCVLDLPDCWAPTCSQEASARVASMEASVDALSPLIFCDDSASGDGFTGNEFKCAFNALRRAIDFTYDKGQCLAKCRLAEWKGKVPAGSCTAGAVTDPKTVTCIAKAEAQAIKFTDRYCNPGVTSYADPLECHGATTGAGWVAQAGAMVDTEDPSFFCTEP
jgi:hypothetical protein